MKQTLHSADMSGVGRAMVQFYFFQGLQACIILFK